MLDQIENDNQNRGILDIIENEYLNMVSKIHLKIAI